MLVFHDFNRLLLKNLQFVKDYYFEIIINTENTQLFSSLFSLNLYELIKKNNYRGISPSMIRRFAFALVQCLRLLHKEHIIHCDLKPVSSLIILT